MFPRMAVTSRLLQNICVYVALVMSRKYFRQIRPVIHYVHTCIKYLVSFIIALEKWARSCRNEVLHHDKRHVQNLVGHNSNNNQGRKEGTLCSSSELITNRLQTHVTRMIRLISLQLHMGSLYLFPVFPHGEQNVVNLPPCCHWWHQKLS